MQMKPARPMKILVRTRLIAPTASLAIGVILVNADRHLKGPRATAAPEHLTAVGRSAADPRRASPSWHERRRRKSSMIFQPNCKRTSASRIQLLRGQKNGLEKLGQSTSLASPATTPCWQCN